MFRMVFMPPPPRVPRWMVFCSEGGGWAPTLPPCPRCSEWSSCRHLHEFIGGGLFGNGRLQRGEDDVGGLLDDFQALGQQGSIALIKLDVVRRRGAIDEA